MRNSHLCAVFLAGGSGTRLWPLSVTQRPKQFLTFGGERSLLQQAYDRLVSRVGVQHCWVVGGKTHETLLRAQLKELASDHFLLEPCPRNTAPALAWAAFHLQSLDPEALMVALPADQWIAPEDQASFIDDVEFAAELAGREQALVTFGIPPREAHTGFGYLEQGASDLFKERTYFEVKAFHEKPEAVKAKAYLDSGKYFWNSGMFVWPVSVFLAELKKLAPDIFLSFAALYAMKESKDFWQHFSENFEKLKSISVDYAVMEKASRVLMIPASFQWDDVGSLSSLSRLLPKDEQANASSGDLIALRSHDNVVVTQKPTVLLGMQECLVMETEQAILVASKQEAQALKEVIDLLKQKQRGDLL